MRSRLVHCVGRGELLISVPCPCFNVPAAAVSLLGKVCSCEHAMCAEHRYVGAYMPVRCSLEAAKVYCQKTTHQMDTVPQECDVPFLEALLPHCVGEEAATSNSQSYLNAVKYARTCQPLSMQVR
jgi:hypothetical protein